MTLVDKKKIAVKAVEKKFVFKNFSFGKSKKEKSLIADYSSAVKIDGGKLKKAFTWEQFSVHGSLSKLEDTALGVRRALEVFDYTGEEAKRSFLYVAGSGNTYFYSQKDKRFIQVGLSFSDNPTVLSSFTMDGVENLLFCSADGAYFYDTAQQTIKKVLEKGSTLACAFADRAFVADKTRVYFCAPLAFDDWTDSIHGGGFMDFSSERGEIVGLAKVGDELGVFFRRGVALLKAKGSAKDFERRDIDFSYGEIFSNSVTESGNCVVFLTKNGVFSFDGESFEEVFDDDACGGIAVNNKCECVSFAGEAYIVYNLSSGQKRVIVYNGESRDGYFIELPTMEAMTASKDKLLCSFGGKIYALAENGEFEFSYNRAFLIKQINFSFAGEKTLKSLKLRGTGQVRIGVSSTQGGHVYTVALEKDGSMVCPLLKGKSFDIRLIPLKGGEISGLEANVVFAGR